MKRAKSTKRRRSVLLTVWVTPDEKAAIERTAATEGCSVSDHLRQSALHLHHMALAQAHHDQFGDSS